MSKDELKRRIAELVDACDESNEQQAVKSVLLGLLGAMYANHELAFMDHMAQFAKHLLKQLIATRN